MAASPSSPSKMVSSTNLSLSNSSPWRLKVTVEAQPDNDMFLDLAAEESLTKQTRKPKASRPRLVSKPVSKPMIPPRKAREDTAMSEDSLGLDNISGIFAADLSPILPPVTPKRPLSEVSKTLNTIIVPLKGSEPKQKPPKRKATPARKKAKEIDLSMLEPDTTQSSIATTPKRGRGRPRKSLNNMAEGATGMVNRGNGSVMDAKRENMNQNGTDIESSHPQRPIEDTFHMPSPPSSPIPQTLGRDGMLSEPPLDDQNDFSIMASEGFSMIAPRHTTSMEAPVGLTTPRSTPEVEHNHAEESIILLDPALETRPRQDEGPVSSGSQMSLQTTAVEEEAVEDGVAEEAASLSSKPRARRRRSLRISSRPAVDAPTESSARTSKVMERFRELTNNAAKANELPPSESRDEASSFRRFLQTGPDKIVPGTYEESTVYFANKKPAQGIDRRRQTPAKKSRSGIIEPAEEGYGNILPEHLLPPPRSAGKRRGATVNATPSIRAAVDEPSPKETPAVRRMTSDQFDDEGRSVRWHDDVMGGSFSLHSGSMERPEPDAPQQESTHRLLENEVIIEPFRPHAGKLNDGTLMPLVVRKAWVNRYWVVLTTLSYPDTELVKRSKRSMAKLHPEESAEEAMERRRRILETFPRNNEGHLVLSEQDSNIIDTFEEYMRREILGERRVAGETRRMWGFSRHQIKEALIVVKVSRQRRIQWVVSAGERLEDWGLA
ncbi:hypothetical protein TWF506_008898 [Arthrobotrys conoides]|uniref:Uncharacterized protein n=1 Tax=Arthrobotrys conoides TaxID=74498 RepID=A0AAN8RLX6_9PEZI